MTMVGDMQRSQIETRRDLHGARVAHRQNRFQTGERGQTRCGDQLSFGWARRPMLAEQSRHSEFRRRTKRSSLRGISADRATGDRRRSKGGGVRHRRSQNLRCRPGTKPRSDAHFHEPNRPRASQRGPEIPCPAISRGFFFARIGCGRYREPSF
jgi:hypothetical protein